MSALGADEGVHCRDIRSCRVVLAQFQEPLRIAFDEAAGPTSFSEIRTVRQLTPIPSSELDEIAVTDIRKVEQVFDNAVLATLREDVSTPRVKR
jgi:hypothetical protein